MIVLSVLTLSSLHDLRNKGRKDYFVASVRLSPRYENITPRAPFDQEQVFHGQAVYCVSLASQQ